MGSIAGLGMVYIFAVILLILIFVAISRWVFRINTIVKRLDNISERLDDIVNNGIEVEIVSGKVDKKGKPSEKPKSFVDGIKKGMAE